MKDTNNQGKSFQERLSEAEERRKNATTSDIIAAKRREADSIEASARGSFKAGEDWDERPFTESDLESALDLAETKRKEADRLEATWKRDTKGLRVEIERLKEERNYSGVRERERLRANGFAIVPKEQLERGDAAKLREVCEKMLDLLTAEGFEDGGMSIELDEKQVIMWRNRFRAALSAPPRNCDRPECATAKAAQEVWRREDGGKTAYYEWLLATHKKGGNDAD